MHLSLNINFSYLDTDRHTFVFNIFNDLYVLWNVIFNNSVICWPPLMNLELRVFNLVTVSIALDVTVLAMAEGWAASLPLILWMSVALHLNLFLICSDQKCFQKLDRTKLSTTKYYYPKENLKWLFDFLPLSWGWYHILAVMSKIAVKMAELVDVG